MSGFPALVATMAHIMLKELNDRLEGARYMARVFENKENKMTLDTLRGTTIPRHVASPIRGSLSAIIGMVEQGHVVDAHRALKDLYSAVGSGADAYAHGLTQRPMCGSLQLYAKSIALDFAGLKDTVTISIRNEDGKEGGYATAKRP